MGTSVPAASGGAKLPVRKAMIVLGNEPRHARGLRSSDTRQPLETYHRKRPAWRTPARVRLSRRSRALRPAHSHHVTCYTEGFSHFVTSMTAQVDSGWSGR